MNFLNTNFELAKEQVDASLSGIYSKEDVLNIIESLKQKTLTAINKDELIDAFASAFELQLDRGGYVDMDSAEFSVNYENRIELEHVNILSDNITDTAKDMLNEVLAEYLGL